MAAEDLVDFAQEQPGLLACVHSVFPHAVNFLTLGDQLITLTNQDDITPMGLTVNSRENLAGRFTAGDQVVLAGGQIDLLDGKLSINLRNARVWVLGSRRIRLPDLRRKSRGSGCAWFDGSLNSRRRGCCRSCRA